MEEGEEKKKEKKKRKERVIAMGEEGFPKAGPALLTSSSVTAVRCNKRLT
jgi:hypothetical protein